MKNTVKISMGAMCVALSAAIMMASSLIPVLTYAIPAIASLLVGFMMIECDKKWAIAVYFCTSVVCAIVVPEKEAVGVYIGLLGYYPVLKTVLDKPKRFISIIIKTVYFVGVIIGLYELMMRVFGISTEILEEIDKYMVPILVILGLVAFLMFDFALAGLEFNYYRKWQKQVHKIIRNR